MLFTWDPEKAASNLKKHGVSFEEAAEALEDPDALEEADRDESVRMRSIAASPRGRLLFVVHVERGEAVTRIISARRATSRERKMYENANS